MRNNLPVSQTEYVLPDGDILVSTTDLTGRITHCNQGFVQASGFDYDELLGQPHDIVRHQKPSKICGPPSGVAVHGPASSRTGVKTGTIIGCKPM